MANREEEYKSILSVFLPSTAVEPVYCFVRENNVRFRITAARTSKLGDYRRPSPQHPFHEISINGDLPKYFFLMVLLHEMAHLKTFVTYGRDVQPHGHEWQEQYRQLLIKYFNEGHFPAETYPLFRRYTDHVPLNRAAGQELEKALKHYGMVQNEKPQTILDDLPSGTSFRLKSQPDRVFINLEKRRTRHLCSEKGTGRKYLVSGNAEVEVIKN